MTEQVFSPLHSFICGTTGTGKSTMFLKNFERSPLPGIYINPLRNDTPFIYADYKSDESDIVSAVQAGKKIDYQPSRNSKYARGEVALLVQAFFEAGFTQDKPFIFAIDECHVLVREGLRNESIEAIATGGRSAGFRGVFIAQYPAIVSKVVILQCDTHYIFCLSDWANGYFKTKGVNFEDIKSRVEGAAGKVSHKYCKWQNGIITGPFEEKI